MNGLEITELKLSDVRKASENFRVESEFFQKIYLEIVKKFESLLNDRFSMGVVSEIIHPVELPRVYEDKGIRIMLAQNVRNNYLNLSSKVFMHESARSELNKNTIQFDDVVMTRSGANFGQSACYKYDDEIFACADVLVLRPNHVKGGYLSTVLNTWYGKKLMTRGAYGMAQPHIAPPYLWSLLLPRFTKLEVLIDAIVVESVVKLEESNRLYVEADDLFGYRVGLRDWAPPRQTTAIKSFTESFAETGRLDSEYYQPKYDYAYKKLTELKPNTIPALDTFLVEITNGQTPLHHDLSEGDIVFLTAEHVSDFRIDFDSEKRVESRHHLKQLAKTAIRKNDVLITIKGKIGNAAVVEDIPSPTNINQDVGLLRLKDGIDPYYIAGYMNSILGKMFTKRISTGQINPFLGLGNLRTIPVPIFDNADDLGVQIRAKVMAAEKAASKSKRLLATAKRAVEIAIEESEAAALKFIEKNH